MMLPLGNRAGLKKKWEFLLYVLSNDQIFKNKYLAHVIIFKAEIVS